MARRKLGELLDTAGAADAGEVRMTVRQWDNLQRATERARADAQRIYDRDRWQKQRTK